MRKLSALALGVVVFVFVAGGCKRVIKADEAEVQIRAYLDKALPSKVTSVECPDDIEMKQGNTFECKAQFEDMTFAVVVEQKDNEGNVYYQSKNIIVHKSIEDTIEAKLKDTSTPGEVSCGEKPVRLGKTGDMFDCTITLGDGKTDKIRIELTDDIGSWQVASSPSAAPAAPAP